MAQNPQLAREIAGPPTDTEHVQPAPDGSRFETPAGVISMLQRYRDVCEPKTTSLLLASRQTFDASKGPFRGGFIGKFDEREELRRRMAERPAERERRLLFLWYVLELRPTDVARRISVSRVHCYRLRKDALLALCDKQGSLGPPEPGGPRP